MNRRGFLQACLASATAPYVVTSAGVLMAVRKLWTNSPWYLTDPDAWLIVAPPGASIVQFQTRHRYDDLAAALRYAGPRNTIIVVPQRPAQTITDHWRNMLP